MIIRRAFYREAAVTTTAIIAVLVIVLLLFGMTTILGRAVRGDYGQDIVFKLLGWQTVRRVDLLLPLGLYLGVLLTFSRWYRDSEMVVLAACGISISQLLRPVLVLALLAAILTAAAAFYLTPLSARAIDLLKAESTQRPAVAGITPGAFTDATSDGRVVYVTEIAPDGSFSEVFVNNPERGKPRVILAKLGHSFVDARSGDRFVALSDGWAYEGRPGEPAYRVVKFDRYVLRLEERPLIAPTTSAEGLPTRALLKIRDADALAEWHWRLSKPLLAIVLSIYALVLAYTDARRGRLANLFIAVLVYFIYSNLLGLAQTMMKQGKVPLAVGLWWVHALMVAIAFYLLYRRNRNLSLFPRGVRVRA